MYKISVIITTYNRKYEVRRALDSVYAQTKAPFEIILVDDCSEDGTKEYVDSFQFEGLKYFLMPTRLGPGAARNYGIRKAQGEYLAFLDSDNEWYNTKLEAFENVMRGTENKCDVLYSKYKKHVQFETIVLPKSFTGEMGKAEEIWLHNPADASSSIYKKSFLEEIGLFSEEMITNIDWELLLRGRRIRKIEMQEVDKVLTENWTMFDGLSEDKELERKERAKLLSEYSAEIFRAIMESEKAVEREYQNDRKHYEEVEANYKALLYRKSSFYQFLSQWMQLKLEGGSVAEKLLQNGYRKIAIYGAGKHGKFLHQDLKDSEVLVAYFIDRNRDNVQNIEIPVYTLDEELPLVDAIVVSPYLEFQTICQDLERICSYRMLALNELIEW